jgi:hypothetical protein
LSKIRSIVLRRIFQSGNGVKILPRRGRYVESCTVQQNFNVLSRVARIATSLRGHVTKTATLPPEDYPIQSDEKVMYTSVQNALCGRLTGGT